MPRFVIPNCCLALALWGGGTVSFSADTIRLKNGDVIYADAVKDESNHVQYEVGDDSYTIPKSLVKNIEKGPAPQAATSSGANLPVPAYTPATPVIGEEQWLNQVARGGRVDRNALSAIEAQRDPSATAIVYYVAGKQDFLAGDYSTARRDFETALRYDPQNAAVLTFYAALLVRTGDSQPALLYAERAVQQTPDSPDALAVLGYAQFVADHVRDAIESWKKSIALRPDASLRQLLARAQREQNAENNYSERETGHFVLRYEGSQNSDALRSQILSTLESAYQDLSREFGSEPRSSIQVVLYTSQAFFDVTRAPGWVGALNDGKIRIPLQGLTAVTPSLARVLRHELAHSFVNQLSQGRCPDWLNEGLAQMLEPRSLGSRGGSLTQLFQQEREIPLNSLESGLSSFSGTQAGLAYDESLATVAYIRDHYGMSDLLRILDKLGHGESVESALRSTIHCDYRQLQAETGAALLRQFGS